MDRAALLAKLVGLALLAWTGRSIYKHIKERQVARRQNKTEVQSVSEFILNNLLLYLWLAFMLVFSIGLMVNN